MLTIPSDFSISRCNQFLPTSSDHVVDSDNIFIVGVAVVILHTHLCISCRCMLNKTKEQLNSVWFMLFSRGYYNAEIIFKHFLYRETVKLKLGGIALKRFQKAQKHILETEEFISFIEFCFHISSCHLYVIVTFPFKLLC